MIRKIYKMMALLFSILGIIEMIINEPIISGICILFTFICLFRSENL